MSETTFAPVGHFCWPELAARDLEGTQAFYGALFGWTFEAVPSSGGGYLLIRHAGVDVGGCYQMPEPMLEAQVQPNWTGYVKVADVDAAARRVKPAGGELVAGPFEVEGVGRMAAVKDPDGAPFALWQDGAHAGAGRFRRPGTLCWNELLTRKTEASKAFYSRLLGWTHRDRTDLGMPYTILSMGALDAAGMMPMEGEAWEGIPAHWMHYFGVEDCGKSVERAIALGATPVTPPTPIPNIGTFAILNDPQGATFSLLATAR